MASLRFSTVPRWVPMFASNSANERLGESFEVNGTDRAMVVPGTTGCLGVSFETVGNEARSRAAAIGTTGTLAS
jgi:hypothetical protein